LCCLLRTWRVLLGLYTLIFLQPKANREVALWRIWTWQHHLYIDPMTEGVTIFWLKLQFQSTVVKTRRFHQCFGPDDKLSGLKSTIEIIVFRVSQQNHAAI